MNTGLEINGVVCSNARIIDRKRIDGVAYVQVELEDGRTYWYDATFVVRYAYHPRLVADRHEQLLSRLGGRGR